MSRLDTIVKRAEDFVAKLGYKRKAVKISKDGYGDFSSFFDLLVDIKLSGKTKEDVTKEMIWESMKGQMGYLETSAINASEEFRKIQNENRHLKKEKEDLIKEIENGRKITRQNK